jgi:hypothetical protein
LPVAPPLELPPEPPGAEVVEFPELQAAIAKAIPNPTLHARLGVILFTLGKST